MTLALLRQKQPTTKQNKQKRKYFANIAVIYNLAAIFYCVFKVKKKPDNWMSQRLDLSSRHVSCSWSQFNVTSQLPMHDTIQTIDTALLLPFWSGMLLHCLAVCRLSDSSWAHYKLHMRCHWKLVIGISEGAYGECQYNRECFDFIFEPLWPLWRFGTMVRELKKENSRPFLGRLIFFRQWVNGVGFLTCFNTFNT